MSEAQRRTRGSVSRPHSAAAPDRRSRRSQLDCGGHRRVRRRFRLHAAVRATRTARGREGAEQITDTIGGSFASILKVAYEKGASLLKFGGDALLLWFQGDDHAARACAAAVRMRRDTRRGRKDRAAGRQSHAADVAGRAHGTLPFLRGRHVAPRDAAHRPGVDPHGRDGARGRTPAKYSSARRRPPSCPRIAWANPGHRACCCCASLPATKNRFRTFRGPIRRPSLTAALPVARDPRPRAGRRRSVRASPRHHRLHPLRGDGRADRATAARRPPQRRCTSW